MTSRNELERLFEQDIEATAPVHGGSLAPAVGRQIAERQALVQRRAILGGSTVLGAIIVVVFSGPGLAGVLGLLAGLAPDTAGLSVALQDFPQLLAGLADNSMALPLLVAVLAALATPFLAEAD